MVLPPEILLQIHQISNIDTRQILESALSSGFIRHNIKVPNVSPPTIGTVDDRYNSIVINLPNGKTMKFVKNTMSANLIQILCSTYNDEWISRSSLEYGSNGALFRSTDGKIEDYDTPRKFSMSMSGFKRSQDD